MDLAEKQAELAYLLSIRDAALQLQSSFQKLNEDLKGLAYESEESLKIVKCWAEVFSTSRQIYDAAKKNPESVFVKVKLDHKQPSVKTGF